MSVETITTFLDGATAEDLSAVAGLRALLDGADDSGTMEREAWLARLGEQLADVAGEIGSGGSAGPSAHVDGEVVLRVAESRVLPRLEAAGVAHRRPEPSDWDRVALSLPMGDLSDEARTHLRALVDRSISELERARSQAYTALDAPDVTMRPDETRSRLHAKALSKSFRRRKVVSEVDLDVRQGEIVGLLGPNGAGKTTTFYMMVGLIPPDSGSVHLDEEDLTGVPMYRRARKGVGYLAQEPSVFRKLTVEDNVLAILETLKLSRKEEKERLDHLLNELGLTGLRKSMAYALSGGERRRLEITRALVQRPKFMLLDEPFAGIDPIAVNDIQHIVSGLKSRSIGVIISDHNVEQTLEIVDRAYIMYEGRIRVSGTVSELVWNDEVADIYLGPSLTTRMRQRFPEPLHT